MPQALALAAQIVATISMLVVPVLGLFLLSLALRQATARKAPVPVRKVRHPATAVESVNSDG